MDDFDFFDFTGSSEREYFSDEVIVIGSDEEFGDGFDFDEEEPTFVYEHRQSYFDIDDAPSVTFEPLPSQFELDRICQPTCPSPLKTTEPAPTLSSQSSTKVTVCESECTICCSPLGEFPPGCSNRTASFFMDCKHVYHTECISRWLHTGKSCPICRKPVSKTNRVVPLSFLRFELRNIDQSGQVAPSCDDQERIMQLQSDIHGLQSQMNQSKTKMKALETIILTKETQLKNDQTTIIVLRNQLEQQKQKLEEAERLHKVHQAEQQEKDTIVSKLKVGVSVLKKQLDSVKVNNVIKEREFAEEVEKIRRKYEFENIKLQSDIQLLCQKKTCDCVNVLDDYKKREARLQKQNDEMRLVISNYEKNMKNAMDIDKKYKENSDIHSPIIAPGAALFKKAAPKKHASMTTVSSDGMGGLKLARPFAAEKMKKKSYLLSNKFKPY